VIAASYMASVADPGAGLQVTTVLETTWEGDVLVGSSRERRGFDLSVDPGVSAQMLARAARLAPGLRRLPVAAAWAGLRPWLPDHLPAIGPSSQVDGLWLATGHEGAGVGLGPITGKAIAKCYVGDAVGLDLAAFNPDRFAAVTAPSH
jgi:glycine/D-amino acid oxidase-like deaminating enzyme